MALVRRGFGALDVNAPSIGSACTTGAGQAGTVQEWFDEDMGMVVGLICTTTGARVVKPSRFAPPPPAYVPPPPRTGPRGPNALARAADAILATLPPGSGQNPIGRSASYPWPHDPSAESVHDDQYGGQRAVPWYWAHPVRDASGLIDWTGPDSNQPAPNLSQAQALAGAVLSSGGDRSPFADYNSLDPDSTGGTYAPAQPPRYTPEPFVPPPSSGGTSAPRTPAPPVPDAPPSGGGNRAPVEPPLDDPFAPPHQIPPPVNDPFGDTSGWPGGAGGGGAAAGVTGSGELLAVGGLVAAFLLFGGRRKK